MNRTLRQEGVRSRDRRDQPYPQVIHRIEGSAIHEAPGSRCAALAFPLRAPHPLSRGLRRGRT